MGIRDFLKKPRAPRQPKPTSRPVPPDEAQPKNGRLTLAVIASVLLLIPLAVLNVRLILDPSTAGKAFGTSVSCRPTQTQAATSLTCPVVEEKSVDLRPEATFYTRLSAQEEHHRGPESGPIAERDLSPPLPSTATAGGGKATDKTKARSRGERGPAVAKTSSPTHPMEGLPRPDGGAKVYMVQVGAFTHPRIAQQWALNWKSRGYDVVLKPVARPITGVTYRLYLGKFESQKDADALVERLKAKEGISALTLMVRN